MFVLNARLIGLQTPTAGYYSMPRIPMNHHYYTTGQSIPVYANGDISHGSTGAVDQQQMPPTPPTPQQQQQQQQHHHHHHQQQQQQQQQQHHPQQQQANVDALSNGLMQTYICRIPPHQYAMVNRVLVWGIVLSSRL